MGALSRYRHRGNEWPALFDMGDDFNRLFEQFGKSLSWPDQGRFAPAMDIHETEDAYVVEADVPGLKKDDIHLEVADNVLTIKGERKEQKEEKEKNYHRVERSFGSFARSVALPNGIDGTKVSAKFEDGVLKVTLPKHEASKPRRVEVKVS